MANLQVHLQKAEHNERFAESFDLDETPYLDWVVTGYFYSALHLVEAYLARSNKHSLEHRARDSAIHRDINLRKIFSDYGKLKTHSTNARYANYPFTPKDVRERVKPALERIKDRLASFISPPE